jgi:phage shock protein A
MPLIRRVTDILSANLNDLVDRFEDPARMLKQAVREMEQSLRVAMDGAVAAVANEKLLAHQVVDCRRQSERWQARVEQAVESADDERARRAIAKRIHFDEQFESLEQQQQSAAALCRSLRRQIETMQRKLADAKQTLTELSARKAVAESRKYFVINASLGIGDSASKVDHWIKRLELAEAQADAWCELLEVDEEDSGADEQHARVEQELAALKERRGK